MATDGRRHAAVRVEEGVSTQLGRKWPARRSSKEAAGNPSNREALPIAGHRSRYRVRSI
jgi:hypothetical protein